jgi:uncharacterized membrane protein YhaH (DUF805 family)
MFTLVNTVIVTVLAALLGIGAALSNVDNRTVSPLIFLSGALIVIYVLATLVPSLAVSVRRLHDAGYTGWLELLEFVGLRIVVLVFHIMDSQPGANKWGPNPKTGATALPTAPAHDFPASR